MTRVIATVLLLLIFPVIVIAEEDDPKYKISPTPDPTAPAGVYIPMDIEDSFIELEKMLSPELIKEMKQSTEDKMVIYHKGLGMWIRNNWGLWKGSRLAKYFDNLGIQHPDDMSGIILVSFWRHLNHKSIQLNAQIDCYKRWWKEQERLIKESKDPNSYSVPDFDCP